MGNCGPIFKENGRLILEPSKPSTSLKEKLHNIKKPASSLGIRVILASQARGVLDFFIRIWQPITPLLLLERVIGLLQQMNCKLSQVTVWVSDSKEKVQKISQFWRIQGEIELESHWMLETLTLVDIRRLSFMEAPKTRIITMLIPLIFLILL